MPAQTARRDGALLVAAFFWLAATAWLRPLALPDEGRYIGVAWGMLHSGDWLVPMLDGLPYFHKPPLFYWITATALALSDTTVAARAAPWLGACLGTASLFLFAGRWAGRDTALAGLFALVTAPLFFFGAQYANLDMLVAGCIAATILAFTHAVLLGREDAAWKRTVLLAYVLCALGVLAKGLIGIVLPGMVLVLWLLVERRWQAMFQLLWWPGILCFLIVAAPWFVLMQQRFESFTHYFFVVQHFQRFSEGGFNNPRGPWFYPVVLAAATLPWSLWWAGARQREWRERSEPAAARRLMLLWAVAITLFFSLPRSKLAGYILPVVPPLIYLAADAATALRARAPRWQSAWRIAAAVAVAACLAGTALLARHADGSQGELARLLRERAAPADEVFALDEYRYGLLFEARLRKPVVVAADWSPKAVASRDNWRRELADAAAFAEHREWLVEHDAVLPRACAAAGVAWFVGNTNIIEEFPWLKHAEKVATRGELSLWRAAADTPLRRDQCRGKPSASSGSTSSPPRR
ncbi:glycosyltransferase family 39 protein [Ramlibacter sp. PS4R-6]|uniref:glycosyltransferase family 39 protein n=1 Tax=Ramlibacter sp. PS4R-6 TaxID=3133438 RepID=UPI0030AEF3AA